ncbi:MAG TPA: RNA polymerase sigma factor [Saprospiraceae bacterium]|nr:RNA polymerase sigma factor [Saprospiraceae bacterium]HMQ81467.1 RNA polymerase sigma factor [Saprospiraceae bacterium]
MHKILVPACFSAVNTKKHVFCINRNMKAVIRNLKPVTEKTLIDACKQNDRRAQKTLFDRYSPVMQGVCLRYVKRLEDAEDVLAEAFFKVLTHIHQYKGEGSFEGWIRRIVVNECLMFLRRHHNFRLTVELDQTDYKEVQTEENTVDELAASDILRLMDQLPTGYRTVFNLYALEGYKHREIADILNISINTSKSQLILAKKRLQELLADMQYPDSHFRDSADQNS